MCPPRNPSSRAALRSSVAFGNHRASPSWSCHLFRLLRLPRTATSELSDAEAGRGGKAGSGPPPVRKGVGDAGLCALICIRFSTRLSQPIICVRLRLGWYELTGRHAQDAL